MRDLLHYLQAPYELGARGPDTYDCWGQVREIRHLLCGKRLLPLYPSVNSRAPRAITKGWREVTADMRRCGPEHGALVSVFRGKLCIHVAVVVEVPEGLRVVETNEHNGARIMRVEQFEQMYTRVEYHND